mmetsp:Transcript_34445/g.68419  ORF Transcript_34445/g.68419 Transcript_34445/m.68419 type:complete len:296 (-) Transcript_34445:326-1213(-)
MASSRGVRAARTPAVGPWLSKTCSWNASASTKKAYPKRWELIARMIRTRSAVQVHMHAQTHAAATAATLARTAVVRGPRKRAAVVKWAGPQVTTPPSLRKRVAHRPLAERVAELHQASESERKKLFLHSTCPKPEAGGGSIFVGVGWKDSYWIDSINQNDLCHSLGRFANEVKAALVYDERAAQCGRPVNFVVEGSGQSKSVKVKILTREFAEGEGAKVKEPACEDSSGETARTNHERAGAPEKAVNPPSEGQVAAAKSKRPRRNATNFRKALVTLHRGRVVHSAPEQTVDAANL